MSVTIDFIDKITNPRPVISGSTTEPQALLNFNGQNYLVNASGGRWSVQVSEAGALVNDGAYLAGVISGAYAAQRTINFVQPLNEARDVPVFNIPEPEPVVEALAGAAIPVQGEFMGLVGSTSSSCDLLGTIQSLASTVTLTIRDTAGEIIGTIKESTASLAISIKNAMGDVFGGSGGLFNTIKGHITDMYEWAQEASAAMTETVQGAIDWTRDKIAAGQAFLYDQVVAVRASIAQMTTEVVDYMSGIFSKFTGEAGLLTSAMNTIRDAVSTVRTLVSDIMSYVGDGIRSFATATCNTINTVLAGTPNDAFSNITNGAVDAATKSFAAAKSIFNDGVSSIKEVHERILDSTGIGDVLGDGVTSTQSHVAGLTASSDIVATGTQANRSELTALINNPPAMPA